MVTARAFAAVLLVSFSTAAPSVVAQPPAASQAGPGEVLLEIDAVGFSRTPADVASLRVKFDAEGDTLAAARAGLEARQRRVVDAAVRAGVPRADIRLRPLFGPGYIDASRIPELDGPRPAANEVLPTEREEEKFEAAGAVEIRIRDVRRAQTVRSAIEAAGVRDVPKVKYALLDPRGSRQAAKANAVDQARTDAEAYAARLNMRVLRIAKVTERIGVQPNSIFGAVSAANSTTPGRPFSFGGEDDEEVIVTPAFVGVDFVLTPR